MAPDNLHSRLADGVRSSWETSPSKGGRRVGCPHGGVVRRHLASISGMAGSRAIGYCYATDDTTVDVLPSRRARHGVPGRAIGTDADVRTLYNRYERIRRHVEYPRVNWAHVPHSWRCELRRREASCFWWALSHVVSDHWDLVETLRLFSPEAVNLSGGVTATQAVHLLRHTELSVYVHDILLGEIVSIHDGASTRGLLFSYTTGGGRFQPHWMPVLRVRVPEFPVGERLLENVFQGVKLSHPAFALEIAQHRLTLASDELRMLQGLPASGMAEMGMQPLVGPVLDGGLVFFGPPAPPWIGSEPIPPAPPLPAYPGWAYLSTNAKGWEADLVLKDAYDDLFADLFRSEIKQRRLFFEQQVLAFTSMQELCRSAWLEANDLSVERAKLLGFGYEAPPMHKTSWMWSPCWIRDADPGVAPESPPINSTFENRPTYAGGEGIISALSALKDTMFDRLRPTGQTHWYEWIGQAIRDPVPRFARVQAKVAQLPVLRCLASQWRPAYSGLGYSTGSMLELRDAILVGAALTARDLLYVRDVPVDPRDPRVLSNGCWNPDVVRSISTTQGSSFRLVERAPVVFMGERYRLFRPVPELRGLATKIRALNPFSWEVVHKVQLAYGRTVLGKGLLPTEDAKYRFEYGLLANFMPQALKGYFLDARNEEFGLPKRSGIPPQTVFDSMNAEYHAASLRYGVPAFHIE